MLFRNLKWNVVGWFRIVSIISYVIIGAGLATMAYNYATTGSALRLGLSFTGGTDVTVRYTAPVAKEKLAAALVSEAGVTDARINSLSKAGEAPGQRWTIETQKDFGDKSAPLYKALDSVGTRDAAATSVSTVGPSLSREYLFNALKALVIAIAIQFFYVAFRFGWNLIFGWVCVVALVRDSFMMIGIYAIAGRRVDDAFLAAVLTVIGYSIMDTIVILDRIRENVKVLDGKPFDEIVNTSILQTMTRSVNTLATVVITLVALLAFGGASLRNFAFALLVGICSGGYHSIFYSAPLVAVLQKRAARGGKTGAIFRRHTLESGPKTVAQARAKSGMQAKDREEIVAARRARRDRERDASKRSTPVAPKYKRSREDDVDFEQFEKRNFGVPERSVERDPDHHDEMVDPLDAQTMGLHDEAAELGHEEIRLNIPDEPAAPEAPVPTEPHPSTKAP